MSADLSPLPRATVPESAVDALAELLLWFARDEADRRRVENDNARPLPQKEPS